jgi:hypothetical protein
LVITERAQLLDPKNEGAKTMFTQQEAKAAIKKCKLVFFRHGADTIEEVTGKRARKVLADEYGFTYKVTVIGDVAWLDSQSWVEYHA